MLPRVLNQGARHEACSTREVDGNLSGNLTGRGRLVDTVGMKLKETACEAVHWGHRPTLRRDERRCAILVVPPRLVNSRQTKYTSQF